MMSVDSQGNDNIIRPVIVVVGYDRTKALNRLLNSLANADYEGLHDITLIAV